MTPAAMADLHARAEHLTQPWTPAGFDGVLGGRGTFVVSTDVSFAVGRVIADGAELLLMAVDPDHTRQGHGSQVLREFEGEAARRGATQGFLEVAAPNAAALALYAKAGWAEDGQRRKYYTLQDGNKADAILMSKRLQA